MRTALREGRVDDATGLVNDINPDILDTNARLFFRLQLQRFIELVSSGSPIDALSFAETELVPLLDGTAAESYRDELEETAALLAFPQPDVFVLSDLQRG